MPIAICTRNVAAGIVLISFAVYLFLFFFVCFSNVCFWRNKDAYIMVNTFSQLPQTESQQQMNWKITGVATHSKIGGRAPSRGGGVKKHRR